MNIGDLLRRTRWLALPIAVAALAMLPWVTSDTVVQYGINMLLIATLTQGWNVIGGYAGYPSFGNSVFYGLGTYGTAIAMAQFHTSFGVGLVWAAILGVACALLFGIPILRLRGPYFAIATLGLAAVMSAIIATIDIAGKNIGLILPLFRGDTMFYEMSLVLLVAATATVAWIANSRFGAGLVAIREDEDAAQVMGINTTMYKVGALTVAAFFSALAGGIHAYWITFIDPASAFDPTLNVRMVIMTLFGGPGTVFGPVIGALVLSGTSEILASKATNVASLFYGIVIVLAVLLMPKGLLDLFEGFRYARWRYFTDNLRRFRI
jgi:branched-chain amino acid transport system permease protein